VAYYPDDPFLSGDDRRGRWTPIGGGRNPDGTTVNGGRPYSWDGNPLPGRGGVQNGGNAGGMGAGATIAPGSWTSTTVSGHPFKGLGDRLQSSILERLMSQRGQEGTEIRGLQGGGIAWNHLEDPYGRMTTETNTFRPGAAVAPPRKRLLDQIGAPGVFEKVLDENGWPKEAFPGPWRKNGLRSDGAPMQYTRPDGTPIANPYLPNGIPRDPETFDPYQNQRRPVAF
jgi:hypothetical protein